MIIFCLVRVAGLAASALSTLLFAEAAVAQTAAEIDARIARIEQGLAPRVQVDGRKYESRWLTEVMREKNVPAVSIALINDGRIEWARSYGFADAASNRPATTETLFQAASISKPVAAMGALDLVESGHLMLDAPVNAKLVSWKIPENTFTNEVPVTLRHILSHSAGLTVHGFSGYERGKLMPTIRQVLQGTAPANSAAVVVDQRPGASFRYSGGGYTVAQLLMTDVTGKSFPEMMDKHVLRPLGMASSAYSQVLPAQLAQRAATGHNGQGSAIAGLYHVYPEMAAAGLWTTPSDLARWVIAVQDALAGRSDRVLKQVTARAMVTPGLGDRGLGVIVEGEGESLRFQHGGTNDGFQGQFIGFVNRGQGVVVMTNGDTGHAVIAQLVQAIAAEYGWPGFKPKILVPTKVSLASLEGLAGRYSAGQAVATISIRPADGSLEISAPNGQQTELIPQGSDLFIDVDRSTRFQFVRDPSGRATEITVMGSKLKRIP
jgi:CubicO group peptidase (beta-lactamase class C family)